MRSLARPDHADMRIAHPAVPILVIKEGDTGKREIALPLSEFAESPAPIR